jgi:hypothetical protein
VHRLAPLILTVLVAAACGGAKTSPPLRVTNSYLGLDCGDSFPCAHLGIAVWLAKPAEGVSATVHGHVVILRRTSRLVWEGFVRDRRAERIAGEMERHVFVRIEARAPDGSVRRRTISAPISPGWG